MLKRAPATWRSTSIASWWTSACSRHRHPEERQRKEELLFSREDLNRVWVLRRILNPLSPTEAMELLLEPHQQDQVERRVRRRDDEGLTAQYEADESGCARTAEVRRGGRRHRSSTGTAAPTRTSRSVPSRSAAAASRRRSPGARHSPDVRVRREPGGRAAGSRLAFWNHPAPTRSPTLAAGLRARRTSGRSQDIHRVRRAGIPLHREEATCHSIRCTSRCAAPLPSLRTTVHVQGAHLARARYGTPRSGLGPGRYEPSLVSARERQARRRRRAGSDSGERSSCPKATRASRTAPVIDNGFSQWHSDGTGDNRVALRSRDRQHLSRGVAAGRTIELHAQPLWVCLDATGTFLGLAQIREHVVATEGSASGGDLLVRAV